MTDQSHSLPGSSTNSDLDLGPGPETERGCLWVLVVVASAVLAAIVALTSIQVVLRFGFNKPQTWAEEISRYLFVWSVFLGAAIAVARDKHIRVDVLLMILGPKARITLAVIHRLVELFAFGILLYAGVILAWNNRAAQFYTIDGAPLILFYLAAPISAACMVFYLLRAFRRTKS